MPGRRVAGMAAFLDADAGVADNVFSLSYDLVFQAAGSFALGSFEITADGRTLETEPVAVQVNPRDNAEVTVEVSVAPERIRVGDDFGSAFAASRFVAPDVFDFADPSGASGSGTTRRWNLRAAVAGEFVIPPVRVTDPGGTYESEPLTVVIEPPDVEVQATLGAGSIWVGGEFLRPATGFGPRPGTRSWPSFDGFRVLERQPWGGFEDLNLEGRSLEQDMVRRVTLLPGEPGLLSVGRGILEARRDSFGGLRRATGRAETSSVILASEPFTVEVLPLPEEGRPASFRGHVGTLSVGSWVDRTRVAAGETVTLEVKVSGEGHVETLADPEIGVPDGFTISEPEISTDSRERRSVLSGSRTYIYRLTAVDPGTYRIPAVEMSFFDAGTESYGTARGHPFTITVVPAGGEER